MTNTNLFILISFFFISFYSTPLFFSFNAMLPFIIIVAIIILYLFDNKKLAQELYFTNNFDNININATDYAFEAINYFYNVKKINTTIKIKESIHTYAKMERDINHAIEKPNKYDFLNRLMEEIGKELYSSPSADVILQSKEATNFFKKQLLVFMIFQYCKDIPTRTSLFEEIWGNKDAIIQETIMSATNVSTTTKLMPLYKFSEDRICEKPESNVRRLFNVNLLPILGDYDSINAWKFEFSKYKQKLTWMIISEIEESKITYVTNKTNPASLLYFRWNDLRYLRDAVIRDDLYEWQEHRIWGPKFLDFALYQFYSHTNMEFCMTGLSILESEFKDTEFVKTPIKNIFRRPPCLFDWNTGLQILKDEQRELIFEYLKSKGLQFPNITITELIKLWENDPEYKDLLKTDEYKNLYNYQEDVLY